MNGEASRNDSLTLLQHSVYVVNSENLGPSMHRAIKFRTALNKVSKKVEVTNKHETGNLAQCPLHTHVNPIKPPIAEDIPAKNSPDPGVGYAYAKQAAPMPIWAKDAKTRTSNACL